MHRLTRDRSKWGVSALLAGLGVAHVGFTGPYNGCRLPGTVVSLDGRTTSHSVVYRAPDGSILVEIREPAGEAADIICPSEGAVYMPCYQAFLGDVPENNHFLITPLFALIADDRYRARWSHHFDDDEPTRGAVIRP